MTGPDQLTRTLPDHRSQLAVGATRTDAGYDPVLVGGLDQARALEDITWLPVAAMKDGSPVFYRFAVPGEL
jgi:hypothetical protein